MRVFALYFFLISNFSLSQDSLTGKIFEKEKDTTMLLDLFLKSKLNVVARTVSMTTINNGFLKDDYAIASGIGIGVTTKVFHGIQAGVSSYVVYNFYSSDLVLLDSSTLSPNRYEAGLFDIQNLSAKNNLIRLENLFIKYLWSKSELVVGKMKLNSPFLNPQDGRMNTSLEEGIWLKLHEFNKLKLNGGWFWNISPRSTTKWFSVANSIGIYSSGVTETGSKSNYAGNISGKGLALLNIDYSVGKNLKITLWEMMLDRVMNTAMIEVNTSFGKDIQYYQGAMFIRQDALLNGGNADQTKSYTTTGSEANAISLQLGMKKNKCDLNVNYTLITADGRYLMPREWGRDPFYTFMPRERNEGYGKLNALAIKLNYLFLNGNLKTGMAYGCFLLPDVLDYRLNKYGMPSYHQLNADVSYSFTNFLKGISLRFISVYKFKQGNTYNNLKYIYNKVNMNNTSLIIDFKF